MKILKRKPFPFILITIIVVLSFSIYIITKKDDTKSSILAREYVKMLNVGMDVDWAKTNKGMDSYNRQAVLDFKAKGISHVRIRVSEDINDNLLKKLDTIIHDCIDNGLIPVLAYQGDAVKNNPNNENIDKVVQWWKTISKRYSSYSDLLSFDILIEVTDALNKEPDTLNKLYDKVVSEIRKTNPTRILMLSPRLRSDPSYLKELKIPSGENDYLIAEWHFYAAGPSKTNEKKKWLTGNNEEKKLITDKIDTAIQWQNQTGIPTWVGAWMPGNYNDEDNYSIDEQVTFASFVSKELKKVNIPFAINSDTKFYDRENNQWIDEMSPVLNIILK